MSAVSQPRVAIVDYSLGNLFSVKHACSHVGLDAFVTSDKQEVLSADAVILPGVGAFGDAMHALHVLDLVGPLRAIHESNKPLIGICLGQQLLMSESFEFGRHKGLGIIEGPVVRFDNPQGPKGLLKVPQVGWNRLYRLAGASDPWADTPLAGIREGEAMYFVHSFYVQPADANVVLSWTRYGHIEFCSSIRHGNTYAFQFHPERSGPEGIQIYRNIAAFIRHQSQSEDRQDAA